MTRNFGNGLQPREKIARIYRDSDEGFDLVIVFNGVPNKGIFDIDSAEVRKTQIGSVRASGEVSAFEVLVAMEVARTHASHATPDDHIAVFPDLLNEGRRFFVDRDQLAGLLEKQKHELGPVVIPTRIKEGDFNGSGKDKIGPKKDIDTTTPQCPPVNRPTRAGRAELDELFAHIDDALGDSKGPNSGLEFS